MLLNLYSILVLVYSDKYHRLKVDKKVDIYKSIPPSIQGQHISPAQVYSTIEAPPPRAPTYNPAVAGSIQAADQTSLPSCTGSPISDETAPLLTKHKVN